MNLVSFLRQGGANIAIKYDHTIIIEWVESLHWNFDFPVISDYIQSGSYMIMWALAAKEYIIIENARVEDLYSFIEKLREAWVKVEVCENDCVKVYRAQKLQATKIQTNIFPGFPTDLQAPFAVLMSQAEWISEIHEVLFEWRLGWLSELEKMWLEIKIINPHEAEIHGKWKMQATTVTSWDLRAWCAVVIAWLIASGTTKVTNIAYIKRGYEDFVKTLQALGADIEEIE
jgi:UDP-N-acetylglucosamine 1-carboxyvinyltransferase